jgi:hypothetical protein
LAVGTILGLCFYAGTSSGVLGLVGFAFAVILWVRGTKSINQEWDRVLGDVKHSIELEGRRWLHLAEQEAKAFILPSESGKSALVKPAKHYDFTCLFITPVLIGIYEGTRYDAVSRKLTQGSETREIYFKQIAGVDYRPPDIELKPVTGDPISFKVGSEESAHAIVGQIRLRLRAAHG